MDTDMVRKNDDLGVYVVGESCGIKCFGEDALRLNLPSSIFFGGGCRTIFGNSIYAESLYRPRSLIATS